MGLGGDGRTSRFLDRYPTPRSRGNLGARSQTRPVMKGRDTGDQSSDPEFATENPNAGITTTLPLPAEGRQVPLGEAGDHGGAVAKDVDTRQADGGAVTCSDRPASFMPLSSRLRTPQIPCPRSGFRTLPGRRSAGQPPSGP